MFGIGNMLGAIGSVAASAGLDYFSAKQQNDMARGQAHEAMSFSAQQAKAQMDFEERMSNTAHQREVADLKAAGLNPLLSLNAGASTPAGAMGTGVAAPVVPELSHIAHSVSDFIDLVAKWNQSEAAAAAAEQSRVRTGLLKQERPQKEFGSKVWSFFNRMFDRYEKASAKSDPASALGNQAAEDFKTYIATPPKLEWVPSKE